MIPLPPTFPVGCWMLEVGRWIFLAQLPFEEPRNRPLHLSASSRDLVLVFGSVALVSTLAVLLAVLFRRKRRARRHRSHSHPHSTEANPSSPAPPRQPASSNGPSPNLHHGHKRRRRRHKERPRNPTLAETGGLPPIRSDDPPEPSL